MNQKHVYKEGQAPMNTGSMTRPARFNLRLTCSARGRTHSVLIALREKYDLPKDASFADVWEQKALMILEHHVRDLEIGDSAVRAYTRTKAEPLPPEDYQRYRYEQLKLKFERQPKKEDDHGSR